MRTKTIILIAFTFAINLSVFAQNNAINEVNAQLRAYFGSLNLPPPQRLFLYDMATHVSDSSFFSTNCTGTLDADMWYKIYDEMYHSAYDTSWLKPIDTVWKWGNSFFPDTIPLGIMNFTFFKLKYDALSSNDYFNFDTTNNILTDKIPRLNEPYVDGTVFTSAPTVPSSNFSNPIFRVDPKLIFFDVYNAANFDPSKTELKIDFGDGLGEITFDPTVITHYQVKYTTEGPKVLITSIYDGTGTLIERSNSTLFVISPVAYIPPDQSFDFPGISVGFYSGCNSSGITGKTIIYLEGFDMLDFIKSKSRTVGRIYSEMISHENINQLRNEGYSFLVVDWKNSRIDMRYNALYVLNLIEYLKTQVTDYEQFVIFGESMGGVIGRYVLTYMESTFYSQQNTSPFFQDDNDPNNKFYLEIHGQELHSLPQVWGDLSRRHNTRLLITLDSPHQGANVPMSVQQAYRHVMKIFGSFVSESLEEIATTFNLFLDGQAAQQLLIYHIDTKVSGPCFTYTSADDKTRFFDQLLSLGDYPEFAKVVELSNGSLTGQRQDNYYTYNQRIPNDRLLDFSADLYARILWKRINFLGANIEGFTNPNGCDVILRADLGYYSIKLKLFFWGIKITQTYKPLIALTERADLEPLCTSSGGFVGDHTYISNQPSSSGYSLSNTSWILNLFHYTHTVTGGGCVLFDTHLGFNGLASINFDYSLCSDGLHFCFIPVASALDYGTDVLARIPLDIPSDLISLIEINMSSSVIIGYPDAIPWTNHGHLGAIGNSFRDPFIKNFNNDIPSSPWGPFTYYTCTYASEPVKRGLINLEVGDEELYLENVQLPWTAQYQTEFNIHVNERNPNYYYNGSPPSTGITGCYSKTLPYEILSTGYASFLVDPTPPAVGWTQGSPLLPPPLYLVTNQPMTVCCIDFRGKSDHIGQSSPQNTSETYLKVVPNPSTGNMLNLDFIFESEGSLVQMQIINSLGKLLISQEYPVNTTPQEEHIECNLSMLQLTPGLYIIKLIKKSEILTKKIIIN